MYVCKNCGAHLDPGEKCDCSGGVEISAQDNPDNEKEADKE